MTELFDSGVHNILNHDFTAFVLKLIYLSLHEKPECLHVQHASSDKISFHFDKKIIGVPW